ncbi:hypothetical protein BD779DRAFT_1528663 [Infundibulicybe gibba]|nr:hypothetical protein BD779DRAFT_1528663 [Infundibulicybe gibba]
MNISSSSIKSRWKRIGSGLRRISPLAVPRPATSLIATPLAPHPSKQINESKAKPTVYRSEPPNAPVTTEEAMYITTEAEVEAGRAQRFYYTSSTGSTAYETDYVVREAEHGAADGSAASQADVLEPYTRTPALQVVIPRNGDTRDRKTPGIHIPNDGLFVDLMDSTFPDEPRLLDPEHEETFLPRKIFLPESRPGSPENVMHQQPPAYPGYVTTSPSEGIPMDCGMLPSQLHPRDMGPEQGEVGSGDGRAQVGWVVPFSIDSRPNNPQRDSRESPGGVYDVTHDFETHEASSHTSTPSPSFGRDSQLQSPTNPHYAVASSAPPQSDRPFHAYGWVEYLLPDESLYYVHQTYQVVTDVDLGDETLLDAEFWLQNTGSHEGGFVPLRCFVDHSKQSVVFDSSHEANGDDEHNVRHGYANDREWTF